MVSAFSYGVPQAAALAMFFGSNATLLAASVNAIIITAIFLIILFALSQYYFFTKR